MKIDISLFSKPQNLFESVGMWFFIVEFIEFANQLQYIYLWLRTVLDFEYVKKSPFLISSFIFSSFSFLLHFAKVITGNWGNRWEKKNIVFGGKPNTFTTNCRFFLFLVRALSVVPFPFYTYENIHDWWPHPFWGLEKTKFGSHPTQINWKTKMIEDVSPVRVG